MTDDDSVGLEWSLISAFLTSCQARPVLVSMGHTLNNKAPDDPQQH